MESCTVIMQLLLRPVSTTAVLRIASDSEQYVALRSAALAISLTIARSVQRSTAVVEMVPIE